MRVELKYQGDKQRMSEKNILEEIAEKTRERIRKEKLQFPLDQLKALAEKAPQQPSFLEALKKPGMSYICEVKKASPSKGLIAPEFPYLEIAKEYASQSHFISWEVTLISVRSQKQWIFRSSGRTSRWIST